MNILLMKLIKKAISKGLSTCIVVFEYFDKTSIDLSATSGDVCACTCKNSKCKF